LEQGARGLARDARHHASLRSHRRARPGEARRSRRDAAALPGGRRVEVRLRAREAVAKQRSDLPQTAIHLGESAAHLREPVTEVTADTAEIEANQLDRSL